MRQLGTHPLKHAIILETRPVDGDPREEELKPVGFTVVLRRPKAKDLKLFDKHGEAMVAATAEMIERLSQLDQIEVDNLDGEDFAALGNLLERFAPNGPPTGETRSAT